MSPSVWLARTAPPEDCGGPMAYLAKRQHYSYGYGLEVLTDIHERGTEAVTERAEEIQRLMQWLRLEKFDRTAVNRRLQQYAKGDRTNYHSPNTFTYSCNRRKSQA